jgi:hypothetical protein
MVVTALALNDLRAARDARVRAERRVEILGGLAAHLCVRLTVPRRWRRVRAALVSLHEAAQLEAMAAEREHRWYMAHRRARQLPVATNAELSCACE